MRRVQSTPPENNTATRASPFSGAGMLVTRLRTESSKAARKAVYVDASFCLCLGSRGSSSESLSGWKSQTRRAFLLCSLPGAEAS